MTKVALDVESVLADSNEAALQSTDKLDREQLLGNWEMDDYTWQVYVGVTDAIWRHNPEAIPPEESRIDAYVSDMNKRASVDILTGRQHVDPQVVWWLNQHGIEYDSFQSTGKDKCSFTEYDVYIDDNPEMVGGCGHLLLRDQPWNDEINTEEYKSVDRIYSLAEAVDYL
jgi:hypothetical protein